MSFRTVFLAALLVSVLGGAGFVWKGLNAVSGLVREDAKDDLCTALDADEREQILGVAATTRVDLGNASLGASTCRWAEDANGVSTTFLEVASAPAADAVAALLDQFSPERTAGLDQRAVAQVRRLLEPGVGASGADACRVIEKTFDLSGARVGAHRHVQTTRGIGAQTQVIAQSCIGGRYSSVLVQSPRLPLDDRLDRLVVHALKQAEQQLA
jgi:hypothetical protein